MDIATNLVSAAARSSIKTVEFRSNLTPPYTYDPWAPYPPDAPTNPLLAAVAPTFVVNTPGGPVTFAPYGEPSEYGWIVGAGSAIALVVGAIVLIGWAARRM